MTIVLATTRESFEHALDVADNLDLEAALPALAGPLDSLRVRIDEAWDAIKETLRDAFERGSEYTHDQVAKAIAAAQDAIEAAGQRAREVRDELMLRLQSYLDTRVDDALTLVREKVVVAGRELTLSGVQLTNTITLSGSLSASIQQVATATATGQLEVSASYSSGDGR